MAKNRIGGNNRNGQRTNTVTEEKPLTFRDLAKKVFAKATGGVYTEETVGKLVRELEKHPELEEGVIRSACRDELRMLAWEYRKDTTRNRANAEFVPKHFTNGEQLEIQRICGRYWDWILPIRNGIRLPEATAVDLDEAIEHYDVNVRGITQRREFLCSVRKKLKIGQKVSDVLSEEQLRRLEERSGEEVD